MHKLLLVFFLNILISNANASVCSKLFKEHSSPAQNTKILNVPSKNKHIDIKNIFGVESAETSAFIGFNGATMYIWHKGKRLIIGSIFEYKRARVKKTKFVDKGLLIEIPNLTLEQSSKVLQRMNAAEGKYFINCASGACSILRKAKLIENLPLISSVSPSIAYRQITNPKESNSKIHFQKYLINYSSEKDFLKASRLAELTIATCWSLPFWVISTMWF